MATTIGLKIVEEKKTTKKEEKVEKAKEK